MDNLYLQYHQLVNRFKEGSKLEPLSHSDRGDASSADARMEAAFLRVLEEEVGELRNKSVQS